jgi:methylamine utilization protein MauE
VSLPAATAPYWAAACVLGIAGVAKLRDPRPATAGLALLGLARSESSVRVLAAGEIALAVACIGLGDPGLGWLLAAIYSGFAVCVAWLLRTGHTTVSCGCFGAADYPLSRIHVAVDLGLAAICVIAALSGDLGISVLSSQPVLTRTELVLGAIVAAYGTVAVLTALPSAMASIAKSRSIRPYRHAPEPFSLVSSRPQERS